MTTYQDWAEKTEEIQALQAKWKTIGYAPQKQNTKIFERFRAACDDFFKRKNEHIKSMKGQMNENLDKKKRMCEQAEALKNSTDWKATAEIMSKLQKEWKEVGPVPKKHSDSIWKRFIGACDYFFEQKGKAEASHRSVEHDNLDKKKAIIEKLEAINNGDAPAESFSNTVRELMKEWNNIGHVPYKDKDRIYKQYRALVDSLFNKMNQSASKKKLSNFKSNLKKEGNIYRERERLMRIHDNMKNEIKTYENNIGFLTSSSKKGNSLVTEMNRRIEKLKADLELITQKIAVIDESMKA
jgi:chromosome segregation ATPase